jgi:hypothetical protein
MPYDGVTRRRESLAHSACGSPGREIEGPMAIVILGALITSSALNFLVLPTLALRWGKFGSRSRPTLGARPHASMFANSLSDRALPPV